MPDRYSPLPPGSYTYGGGIAAHATRKVGNWWSDRAVDLMAKALTPVIAVEDLTVTSVTRRPSTGSGVNDGSTVFAQGASGERYAFLHLDPQMLPVSGQRLKAGHPFARIAGGTAGGPHLHWGVERGNPEQLYKGSSGGGVVDAITDAVTSVPPFRNPAFDAGAAIGGGTAGVISSVPDFIRTITNPHNILRGLQVIAGAVLVLVGMVLLIRQVALANDIPAPTRVPLPGGRDLYQSRGYASG